MFKINENEELEVDLTRNGELVLSAMIGILIMIIISCVLMLWNGLDGFTEIIHGWLGVTSTGLDGK